jgi:hypothetical protein
LGADARVQSQRDEIEDPTGGSDIRVAGLARYEAWSAGASNVTGFAQRTALSIVRTRVNGGLRPSAGGRRSVW